VRNGMATSPAVVVMSDVVCGQCGVRFQITHRMASLDRRLAERQAAWLAEQFVWDHIQEHKHRGSIELPQLPDESNGPS
jgi:hypothetical protein